MPETCPSEASCSVSRLSQRAVASAGAVVLLALAPCVVTPGYDLAFDDQLVIPVAVPSLHVGAVSWVQGRPSLLPGEAALLLEPAIAVEPGGAQWPTALRTLPTNGRRP